jgi:peroxin-16
MLSQPREWLTKYSAWVQRNASSVSQIESALRSLNYIIPGRFNEGEILAESYHSSIQLLSLWHDSILLRAVSKLPGMPKIERPLNRYTKYWTVKSKLYRRTAMFLQCIRYTELLWEMAAKRRGERVRWRVVVLIEALKALCRLILLRVTGTRMVVPPLPEREPIPEESDEPALSFEEEMGLAQVEEIDSAYGSGSDDKSKGKQRDWMMPRTGLTLPTLPNPSDISSFLMKKVLTADDIKPATALLHTIRGSAQLAEILHILRPVAYAIAMSRSKSKSSWQPWLLGISIELAARQLRAVSTSTGVRETPLEKEEWDRRGWAMGWWGLRGAFYENVTKGTLQSVVESKWMPGLVGGILNDYRYLWEEYHFASADM